MDKLKSILATPRAKEQLYNLALLLIVTVGVYLRFYNIAVLDLWFDEAWRACVVSASDWFGAMLSNLYAPLPLMFVFLSNFMVKIFGNTEISLRFLGAFFGCLSLGLIYRLTNQLFGKFPALISTFMLALHPKFIYFSREFKQYSMDIFVTLLALNITEKLFRERNLINYSVFAFFVLFSMFFSFAAVLIFPAIFLVLFIQDISRSDKLAITLNAVVASISFACFLWYYRTMLNPQIAQKLLTFWHERYFSLSSSVWDSVVWFLSRSYEPFRFYVYHVFNPVGGLILDTLVPFLLFLFALGCYLACKKGLHRIIIYCFTPMLVTLFLSMLGRWPYGGERVNAFYFPVLFVPLSAGAAHFFFESRWSKNKKVLAASLFLLLAVAFLPLARLEDFMLTEFSHEIKPGLNAMFRHAKQGDSVYAYLGVAPVFKYYYYYYTPFQNERRVIRDEDVFYGSVMEDKKKIYAEMMEVFKKKKRVWISLPLAIEKDVYAIDQALSKIGKRLLLVSSFHMRTYLFESEIYKGK